MRINRVRQAFFFMGSGEGRVLVSPPFLAGREGVAREVVSCRAPPESNLLDMWAARFLHRGL